jgi:tape measure domain-containing protein
MAKLNDLIVTIGATTRDFDKALGKSMSKLNRFGRNTKRIGRNLTRSLTMPLAGLGVAAVKSAADLEALETSFISLTGGAEQAAAMMKNLNEFTAKTPFQIEAVAKSARQLIASGTGIEDVNTQLQFLGDIAATSGSSIDEIAAIFAKVNAKGKVELENLNQLAERGIPIFTALADATGLPADKLGAGRVSVEEFNTVLKSFAEEGGFAAGAMERLSETAAGKFSTALDNLKLAGAALAADLLPVVKDLIDGFTVFLQRIQDLSPQAKEAILKVALLLGTTGPILTVLPNFIGGIGAAKDAFKLLNSTMLKNPFAAVATAISLVTIALIGMHNATSNGSSKVDDLKKSLGGLDLEAQAMKIDAAMVSQRAYVAQLEAEKRKIMELAPHKRSANSQAGRDLKKLEQALETANIDLQAMMTLEAGVASGLEGMADDAANAADAIEKEMKRVKTSYMTAMGPLMIEGDIDTGVTARLQKIKEGIVDLAQGLNEFEQRASDFAFGLQGAFEGVFSSMIEGTFNFREVMIDTLKKIAVQAAALTAVFLVLAALTGGATGVAEITGGKAGLKYFLAGGFGLPMMADGGLFTGASLAMVGEGAGTSNINPEVVAPLDRLQEMMGGTQVQVTGRISGRDILLTSERNAIDRNRVRGF